MRRRSKSFKSLLRAEGGVTAIEFAFLAPAFFFFFMSMFETGLMLFTDYALQAGTQNVARMIRTGRAQNGGLSAAQFKELVCDKAVVIFDCTNKISVYIQAKPQAQSFTAFAATVPNVINVGPGIPGGAPTTVYNIGAPQCKVVAIVTYDWPLLVNRILLKAISPSTSQGNAFDNTNNGYRRLAAYAIFVNEPFTLTGAALPC